MIEAIAMLYLVGWVCTWLFDTWAHQDITFEGEDIVGRLTAITLWPITIPLALVMAVVDSMEDK